MIDTKHRAYIVTGAGSGIGAATVEHLIAAGAMVTGGDINEAGLDKVAQRLATDRFNPVLFDLGDERSVAALVQAAVKWSGRLDGLVNVAADVSPETMAKDVELGQFNVGLWSQVLQVNLTGTATVVRNALPYLIDSGGGAIVNISSAAAWMGETERPAYAASKIGLHALTRHVARAYGRQHIRCNVVAPGLVLTEAAANLLPHAYKQQMLDKLCLPTLGVPDDIASTIAFLMGDGGRWITGQTISVDGGFLLRE